MRSGNATERSQVLSGLSPTGLAGIDRLLSTALSRWRKPSAVHDPGKIITDLALSLALGGDCLADVALLRCEPGVYGLVGSDPTVSRLIGLLAADVAAVVKAIKDTTGERQGGAAT